MKLIQRNANQDVDKQLADVWKNLEFAVREMDHLTNRVKELEESTVSGDVLLTEKTR